MLANLIDWIKCGLSAADGSMDDARINAGMMVLGYLAMGAYGVLHTPPHDLAAFVQAWAIGGAALAGGIGAWFGLRKDN